MCLLFAPRVYAITNLKCSLQCSANTCRKNVETLNYCAHTCDASKYKACWENGLNALKANPNLAVDQRKELMRRLQSYIKRADDSGDIKNASLNVRKSMH